MPRPTRKNKNRGPRPADQPNGAPAEEAALATAVAEPPAEEQPQAGPRTEEPTEVQPPSNRPPPPRDRTEKFDREKGQKDKPGKDHVAASLNIAKLQSMSITYLEQLAPELTGVNSGNMR